MDTDINRAVSQYVKQSRTLTGRVVQEREPWNELVTVENVRHFAYGTSDDNPLWLDADHARRSPYGRRLAPPAYLMSVLYPVLHGAAVDVPLISLITRMRCSWRRPICLNDRLYGETRQGRVDDVEGRDGKRVVSILTDTIYRDEYGDDVASATATLLRTTRLDDEMLVDRPVYNAGPEELERVREALKTESNCRATALRTEDIGAGYELPPIVRGPLTIGDLVCWHAAIGPPYRAGRLGYLDTLRSPQTVTVNPVTGWPVKNSQEHEDFHLSRLRGISAPFDNGVMRFAWLAPLLTNWIGDAGFLQSLDVRVKAPNIYGDITWYRGTVGKTRPLGTRLLVEIDVTGTNQLGEETTSGRAEVLLPLEDARRPADVSRHAATPRRSEHPPADDSTGFTPIHRMVAEVCRRYPDRVAVSDTKESLSYAELDRRSDVVAHRLRELGVERGARVGALTGRSAHAPVAALGILKAGAIYVPMDVVYPAKRLKSMIDAAAIDAAILSDDTDQGVREITTGLPVVNFVDEDWSVSPIADPDINCLPGDTAYIMFTSGSSGEPRAVKVPHASLSRYLAALRDTLEIVKEDVYLHTASLSFSASTRHSFLPLVVGAQSLIADDHQRADLRELFALMRDRNATVWDTVPTIWQHALDLADRLGELAHGLDLRLIMATGEPLHWRTVERSVRRFGPEVTMVNLYSQTETAGTTCCYRIDPAIVHAEGIVPLGAPLPGAVVHLLDEHLRTAPPGGQGQVYIGGNRLSAGYLNDPELTAIKFVPDPFRPLDGSRLFATGDLARVEDGQLIPCGRIDRRLKVRGYRIDPADIETAARAHPCVERALLVTHKDVLWLFYVPCHANRTVSEEDLRAFLVDRLPPYMVPNGCRQLDAVPLLVNGKTDLEALSMMARDMGRSSTDGPPTDKTEDALVGIWSELLETNEPPVDRSFFELGGDSLMAVQMLAEVERRLDQRLSVDILMEAPTIQAFACRLRAPTEHTTAHGLVTLRDRTGTPPLFCLPGGGGHPTTYRMLVERLPGQYPVYGITYPGLTEGTTAKASIEDMAEDVIRSIKGVYPSGMVNLVGYSFGGLVAFEVAQQLRRTGRKVGLLGLLDTYAPGAVQPGSLFTRAKLHLGALLRTHNKRQYMVERWTRLRQRPDRHQSDWLTRQLENVEPADARTNTVQRLIDYRSAKERAEQQYRPRPYEGRVTLFQADTPAYYRYNRITEAHGWQPFAIGGLKIRRVPGEHLAVFEVTHVDGLAEAIAASLDETGTVPG